MEIVNTRELRMKLASYLDKVDEGEKIFVRRNNRLYAIMSVDQDCIITKKETIEQVTIQALIDYGKSNNDSIPSTLRTLLNDYFRSEMGDRQDALFRKMFADKIMMHCIAKTTLEEFNKLERAAHQVAAEWKENK